MQKCQVDNFFFLINGCEVKIAFLRVRFDIFSSCYWVIALLTKMNIFNLQLMDLLSFFFFLGNSNAPAIKLYVMHSEGKCSMPCSAT